MLIRNLWIKNGLCNGSMGIVRDTIHDENSSPPSLPIAVMVQFHKYSGPTFLQSLKDVFLFYRLLLSLITETIPLKGNSFH